MAMSSAANMEVVDNFHRFLKDYYHDEIYELASKYPDEKRSLYVDWGELYRYDPDLADDYLAQPDKLQDYAEEAIRLYDLPIDVELSRAHVRVQNLHPEEIYGVGELRDEHSNCYVGVEGHIAQVTECDPKIEVAAFECQRCGTLTDIPQNGSDWQEPHGCQGCDRDGPFNINIKESETTDWRKMQIKQPPEKAEQGQGTTITVHLEDDLADPLGSESLEAHVGEDVVVYGTVELEQKGGNRNKSPVFKQYLEGHAIEFEHGGEQIDIAEHKDEFMEAARSEDAYRLFIDSMAPDVYPYGRWPLAFKLGAAYLFASPRIDREDGSTHRGDIHFAAFGPPGIGKSLFSEDIAELSPGCEHRSATGLSSDVGLTAAASQDDFAEGDGWVLKPGILPRAEEHAILDEVDKADVKLSKINDALEGRQIATIDKGGIRAELKTRVGFLAMGNPNDGRWNDHDPIKDQVDVDDSLWSRFDGIVILEDHPDEEMDGKLADHMLASHREDAAKELAEREGRDPDEVDRDVTDTPVSRDALKAWVKYARENIFPQLTDEAEEKLRDYYVEIRNDSANAENSHPTARKLDAGIRFSKAFARLRLSEMVEESDVDMAIELSKSLIGQTFDSEIGALDHDALTEVPSAKAQTQKDRKMNLRQIVSELETNDSGAALEDVLDKAESVGIERSKAEREIEKLKHDKGGIYEPENGVFRTV